MAMGAMGGGGGGANEMVFKDLVLIGGSRSRPRPQALRQDARAGRSAPLINDVDTPYSGMLPGYGGHYTARVPHRPREPAANARLIHAEACGLDTANKLILGAARRCVRLSIDIGSAPKPVPMRGAGGGGGGGGLEAPPRSATAITPVKPIDGFCKRWDAILGASSGWRRRDRAHRRRRRGAGGVELTLSMHHRLSTELRGSGAAELASRCPHLALPHPAAAASRGVRAIFERLVTERRVVVRGTSVLVCDADGAAHGRRPEIPYDEAIWPRRAARRSGSSRPRSRSTRTASSRSTRRWSRPGLTPPATSPRC